MGIVRAGLRVLTWLHEANLLQGYRSVIELGSQDLMMDPSEVNSILKAVGRSGPADEGVSTARGLYRALGLDIYECIDLDGHHRALEHDLNTDLATACGYTEMFDLVTNFGTAEHCFDQRSVFQNMHNLCRPGGIMIHCGPMQGHINHGFFNYQPVLFRDLSVENRYELMGLFVSLSVESEYLAPYSDDLLRNLALTARSECAIYVVLKKTASTPFRVPYQGEWKGAHMVRDQWLWRMYRTHFVAGETEAGSESVMARDWTAVYRLASRWEGMGKIRESEFLFRAVTEAGPVHLRNGAYYHLACLCLSQGDRLGARSLYLRCLELEPGHRKAALALMQLIDLDLR